MTMNACESANMPRLPPMRMRDTSTIPPARSPKPVAMSIEFNPTQLDARKLAPAPSVRKLDPSRLRDGYPILLANILCGSGHTQQAPLPWNGFPCAKSRQRVPDHAALVGDRGPAELLLKRLADGLRQPGAAADIEAIGVRMLSEGLPAELIGELHVLGRFDFLKLVRT